MELTSPVDDVYRLLAKRDLAANLEAWVLARRAMDEASGSALLALHEARLHALRGFLLDVGEHGVQNEALWGISAAMVDVQAMVDECVASWAQIKQLRAQGVESRELTRFYEIDAYFPIGSRDWLNQMTFAARNMADPKWIARMAAKLRGEEDDDEEDEERGEA